MKIIYIYFILTLLFIRQVDGQTINLDGQSIRIGESSESIEKKFDTDIYVWAIDTSNHENSVDIFKYIGDKINGNVVYIARLDFWKDIEYSQNYLKDKKFTHNNSLSSVKKYWDVGLNNNSSTLNFLQKFYSIIEKNGIDEYSIGISTQKSLEPNLEWKVIDLRIRPNVSITIEFDNKNEYRLYEDIWKDNAFSENHYVLVFYDSKLLCGKEKLICKEYSTEDEANKKMRELDWEYISKGLPPVQGKIIRYQDAFTIDLPTDK